MNVLSKLTILGIALLAVTASEAAPRLPASDAFRSERTEVQLVAEERSVEPGQPFRVGLRFRMAPGWHVYWVNPGDSGTAPAIDWSLPEGSSAGAIEWPYPERIAAGPFVNFGYEGEIVLPVSIRPAGSATGNSVRVLADARWLVCKEDCIPERSSFALELPLSTSAPEPSDWADLFARADARRPVEVPGVGAEIVDRGDGTMLVEVSHPADLELGDADIEFFPATPAAVEHAAAVRVERGDERLGLVLTRSPFATGEITALDGVLVARKDAPRGGTVAVALHARRKAVPPVASAALETSLPGALGLAFLGGLLLNAMPCVFPVVSIKVLGLLGHGGDRAGGRRHGLLFAAGILVSFWILAGGLLALRAAGQGVGWGFQLQSPLFLGLLALLFFAMGLEFLGVFEISASFAGRVPVARQRGASSAFLHGLLATVVATPCTAPFMGSAIGFAVLVAPAAAFAVFTALGLGMAAPYVALVFFPGALRFLPRPGRWMETMSQLMAFPLFATVLWLLWVLAAQRGADGVTRALAALLLVGFGAWLLGRFGGEPGLRRRVAGVAIAAAAVAAIWLVVPSEGERAAAGGPAAAASDVAWIEWDPGIVDRLRAEGRPVYVDFTARWCLTCQVNKKVVFGSADVLRTLAEREVALVRADWTSQDPRITRALAQYGRNGVPLNVYFPPGPDSEPRVLPSVLSPGIVLDAIGS